jgi:hypothetical protein
MDSAVGWPIPKPADGGDAMHPVIITILRVKPAPRSDKHIFDCGDPSSWDMGASSIV